MKHNSVKKVIEESKRLSLAARSIFLQEVKKMCRDTLCDFCETPQEDLARNRLKELSLKDWRKHFSNQLRGKGLEIGPLHRPMSRHSKMDIDYIDRLSVADLRKQYPDLAKLPLVEPNIIGNAETMEGIADNRYDFLISAHVIEHMRNPIASLKAWCRVVKPGGLIYLVVPDKRMTFDKSRPRTSLAHIILDYQRPSLERDYEHFLEYSIHADEVHQHEAILAADDIVKRDYSIHFHVFIPPDILDMLEWFSRNVQPISIEDGPSMSPGSDEFHLLIKVHEATS